MNSGDEPSRTPSIHETWRDWTRDIAPDPPVMTRGELLAELRAAGCDVRPRTLQHWEAGGALPYGERRWHRGKPAVLYPLWHTAAVADVAFKLRVRFRSLRSIQPIARDEYRQHAQAWRELERDQGPGAFLPIRWRSTEDSEALPIRALGTVQAWLRAMNAAGEGKVQRAEITLVGENGRATARYIVPVEGPFSEG